MSTNEQFGPVGSGTVHDAVGAYVLGILDDADATAFEAHLAGCEVCAVHLEEFSGLEPMLALLADNPASFAAPAAAPAGPVAAPLTSVGASDERFAQFPVPAQTRPPSVTVQPSAQLLDRLVDEVAVKRAKRRNRRMYLVAAAAALIVGGPVITVVATSDGSTVSNQAAADPHPHSTSPAEDAFFNEMTQKVHATDPATKVTATVGTEAKAWGTHAVLELKNVQGPVQCNLIAVSKTGEEEVVTSWSVPKWGYGIPDSPHPSARSPLYVHGGAAMKRSAIDHFEVRTFDGKRLVEVAA